MDVPVRPDPAEQPVEPGAPADPRPRATLVVISGGGETTADRGKLCLVPACGNDLVQRP